MRFARTIVLLWTAYAVTSCDLTERRIDEIAKCVEAVECELPMDLLLRVIEQYSDGDPDIGQSLVDGVRDVVFYRMENMPSDEYRAFSRMWIDELVPIIAAESNRRNDILDQLIAEADEQYRVGVASPADALVGFWMDVSQRVNTTLDSGYHLMPNGYFVHTLFGGTPTNYAGSWGRWEVTGDELVLHYRTLIFIEESVSRLEPVDDVVRIPTSNLRDRDGDDPPAFSGRFPFPHAIGQGRMMQELPLVEYLRTSNLGLWEGAPSIVPSEYEDLRQLRHTVWQTNFDAERGAFIELPFER